MNPGAVLERRPHRAAKVRGEKKMVATTSALTLIALNAWVRFELSRYGQRNLSARPIEQPFEVLYNGKRGMAALWITLLARRTPHMQIVRVSKDGAEGRVLAESRIAIPNRLVLSESLAICLERQRVMIERAQHRMEEIDTIDSLPLVKMPGKAESVSLANVACFLGRNVVDKLLNLPRKWLMRRDHWAIALNSEGLSGNKALYRDTAAIEDAKWSLTIPGAKDRFYADPFLWKGKDGRCHLFFEDLPYSTQKGVISYVALDPVSKTWCGTPQVVLERDYHLSYPFLFEHEGDIFMIPETSANKTIEVYRATSFPLKWTPHAVLMENIVAADATLHREGDTWWLFASVKEDSGPNWDELSLFHSDSPFGPWTAHPANPVISDCRHARMAGNVFRDTQGRLIRPAQNCEESYGAALTFSEITELSKTGYAETSLFDKKPPAHRSGLHTWNSNGEFTVVDVKMDLNRWARDQMIGTRL
jgi:hypothetical protein